MKIEVATEEVPPNRLHFSLQQATGETASGVPFQFYGTDTALYLTLGGRKERIDLDELVEAWALKMAANVSLYPDAPPQ